MVNAADSQDIITPDNLLFYFKYHFQFITFAQKYRTVISRTALAAVLIHPVASKNRG
jgi:hypothetical protein